MEQRYYWALFQLPSDCGTISYVTDIHPIKKARMHGYLLLNWREITQQEYEEFR